MREPFVGRASELEALAGALDDAVGGLTRVVLLAGEAGIGKTRLAAELAARAGSAGARVVWGRAWDEGGAPAGWPLLSILQGLCAQAPAARPELEAAMEALHGSTDDADRFAMLESVSRALERAAADAPVVALLDDLHWADAATLGALKFVARQVRRARLLLVGTYREVDAKLSPITSRVLADVAREGRTIALSPLTRQDVAVLVGRVGGEAVADRVFRATRGNPFFVGEIVRSAASERALEDDDLPLPDGARAMVVRRLEQLPDASRALLEVAAAIGSEIETALLRDAAARAGVSGPAEALAAAERHAVLEAARPGKLCFSHDIVRETVLAEAGGDRLSRAHRAVAACLEARAADPGEIAVHLFACDDPAAIEHAVEGGRRALVRGAFEDAAGLFERALERRAALGDPDGETVELMLALADALGRASHARRSSETCSRAAEIAKRLDSPVLFARAALGYGSVPSFGRVDRGHVELLRAALAWLGDDPPLRAVLTARLASASQPSPAPQEPLALAREAIASARGLGDRATLSRVLDVARPAFRALDGVDERVALDRESLGLAAELGDGTLALRARQRLATDLLERGDIGECEAHLDEVERIGAESRRPAVLLQAALARTSVAVLRGCFDEADRWLRTALDRYRLLPDAETMFPGNPLVLAKVMCSKARARVEDEDELGTVDLSVGPLSDILHASLRAHAGRLPQAREALDRVVARGEHVSMNYLPRALLPEVVATLDDAPRAAILRPLVAELDGRNVAMFGGVCEGAAARLLGLLSATLRRFDEAERWFDAALAMNERLGATPFVHATRLARAEMRLSRGEPGDEAEARRLLASAAEGFASLGMTTKVARAKARLDGLVGPIGSAQPAPPSPVWPSASLRRDGDAWRIELDGASALLKDAHGLHYLARLLESPDAEVHVADLAALVRGEDAELPGDAGPGLDQVAKDAYRRRLADLRDAVDEATAFGDGGRAERARAEMAMLAEELARAVGLGGRDRRASSKAERMRVNVTLRIRKAIKKIAVVSPRVGEHLDRSVRTGSFCAYEPVPGLRVTT